MYGLFDKLIILLCCLVLYITNLNNSYLVVPVILTVTISAFITYINKRFFTLILFIIYLFMFMWNYEFMYFLPLFYYDLFEEKPYIFLGCMLPIILNFHKIPSTILFLLVILMVIAYFVKKRTLEIELIKNQYIILRDEAKELSDNLNIKNQNLLEKKEYEISLATLNERNRIAREIHDTVGHLLSSSILQIGAIMSLSNKEAEKENLKNIKDTLSKGMDSIRASIHNMHEDSMDLYVQLKNIANEFTFCKITLDYNVVTDFNINTKYAVLFIIKEALANVIKHSDADMILIAVIEHPAFYQLTIFDNGKMSNKDVSKEGMGIIGIKERVDGLKGNFNLDTQKGFKIFITIPKFG